MATNAQVQKFIDEVAASVKKYAPKYNIKVYSPIIAQAILESGKGTSELARNAQNYFGLKYKEGRCPTAIGFYIKEGSEQNPDGSYTPSVMKWFKFANLDGCVNGYFDFINNPRYSNLRGVTDPMKYLELIKADGYATSLNYVNNLYNVIKSYNLTAYDPVYTKTIYRVQVGAFSKKENAEKLKKKLKDNGYSAVIVVITNTNGQEVYRVQVGAFSKKENAEKLKKELKEKMNLDAIIISVVK